jgi:hypothetical protein
MTPVQWGFLVIIGIIIVAAIKAEFQMRVILVVALMIILYVASKSKKKR